MRQATGIEHALNDIFSQLENLLSELTDDQYRIPLDILSGSSIGQHTRHVIEFFAVLMKCYDDGIVNYDMRERNIHLETDRKIALAELSLLKTRIYKIDKPLLLTGCYSQDVNDQITVSSTYYRELIYNLEHAIHHLAILKIAIRESTAITLPEQFGIAFSTIRSR